MAPADDVHAALTAIVNLVDTVRAAPPDAFVPAVEAAAASLGASGTTVWLIDYEQRRLVDLARRRPPADVAVTKAGQAFARGTRLHDDRGDGRGLLYLPLVEGVDRLGVLELELRGTAPAGPDAVRLLSLVVASELVARGRYTDEYAVARRRKQMSLAAELQWEVLPPSSFTTGSVSIAGKLEPAYDVGGDLFDYAHNGTTLHLALLDAVGHGLSASLLATLALAVYRNRRRAGSTVEETVPDIDRAIAKRVGESHYVTAQLAVVSPEGVLRSLNAGHPDPLLFRDGRAVGELRSRPRLPLGLGPLRDAPVPAVAEHALQPGDAVLWYSDGVVEGRPSRGAPYGVDRLVGAVETGLASGLPPWETVRRASHAVVDHFGGHLDDDATILLLRWHPG